MAIDAQGDWCPSMFPKQKELLDACFPSRQNLVLASGPRYSGKTVCCLGAVAQHAWHTDRGNICLLTITQSVGIDSGVWTDLTEIVLPEWIGGDEFPDGGNFGMEWARKPYTQNVTKKPACEIVNKFGNKTKITLESLKNEDEVEARFKGKRYSMIFVNELSKFKKRKTFDTLKQALRMMHLKEEDHLLLCDTNPADEGSQSFIYRLFYEFRTMDDAALAAAFPDTPPETLIPLRNALKLIEFTIDDNLACTPEKKASLMADFAHDPDLLARYFYGKWVTASADALFYQVFRPNFHVVGEPDLPGNPNPLIMVPEAGCYELITGQDPGATNYATAIIEKAIDTRKEGDVEKEVSVFKVLDELVIIGHDFELYEYVEELVEKMLGWEELTGKPGKLIWRHWSDRSAFDMRVPFSDRYWHQHLHEASGGKITLMAADRPPIAHRVDLFRKLLFEERLFFSAAKCPYSIEMCKSIRRGKSAVSVVERTCKEKHILDALTYALASECYDEMARSVRMNIRRRSENELVSCPL
jgi:hypothetical protein